ncbi:hypothetical protein WJX73_008474 [Symbiochloris irregularis]|uniref:Protein kinase domain-containing protein n=1 Tax=Symbiochloris irregularis TaxID=706552 RepID=A0AAW1P200_9CHLO
MRGTFAYIAPEVLTGARCTAKVDIFSLGIVLWELCTSETPHRGRNRPVRVPEECPASIAALIDRCQEFEPNDRPTAKEVVQAILNST